MPTQQQTHYEVLGVRPDANQHDIGRAYNRLKSEMQRETAAPDPRHAARVQKAYQALNDPASREAYDKSLIAPARKRRTALAGSIAVGIAVIVAASYFAFLPPPPAAGPPPPAASEVHSAASFAIGAVKRIDMSGRITPVGEAFAIREGLMVTSCREIAPGSQLVVHISPRDVPARIAAADDARGLCQLAVEGAGSRPLALAGARPRTGDKIYTTRINAVGQVVLLEGTVKKVVEEPVGRVVETSMPLADTGEGGPVLDAFGRVLGAATRAQPTAERARYVAVPESWATESAQDYRSAGPPREVVPEPRPAPGFGRVPRSVEDISPERREKLQKAFRPPPTVPDDL